MALGVIQAARDCGLRVPDDLSVVGFDYIPPAAMVYPPLTTVRQPLAQMGRVATQMLLRLIDNPQLQVEHVALPTELIVRQSCRAPGVRL
jgi:LacI family transcriptional regulator